MINPVELAELLKASEPEIKKILVESHSEASKLLDEIIHQLGFTGAEGYDGLVALGGIAYSEYLKLKPFFHSTDANFLAMYHDVRMLVRALSVMAVTLSKWAGAVPGDVNNVVSGVEGLGKWISSEV